MHLDLANNKPDETSMMSLCSNYSSTWHRFNYINGNVNWGKTSRLQLLLTDKCLRRELNLNPAVCEIPFVLLISVWRQNPGGETCCKPQHIHWCLKKILNDNMKGHAIIR